MSVFPAERSRGIRDSTVPQRRYLDHVTTRHSARPVGLEVETVFHPPASSVFSVPLWFHSDFPPQRHRGTESQLDSIAALTHGTTAEKSLLAAWLIPRRPHGIDFVAAPLTDKE